MLTLTSYFCFGLFCYSKIILLIFARNCALLRQKISVFGILTKPIAFIIIATEHILLYHIYERTLKPSKVEFDV